MTALHVPYTRWTAMTDRQREAFRTANPTTCAWGNPDDTGMVANAAHLTADGTPTDNPRQTVTLAAYSHHPLATDLREALADDPTKVPTRTVDEPDDTYRTRLAAAYAADIEAKRAEDDARTAEPKVERR